MRKPHPPHDGPRPDPRTVEPRLRASLREQAEQRAVDPHRLLADVHTRLADSRPPARSSTGSPTRAHRGPVLPLLVAAAVLAVVGGTTLLARLVDSAGPPTADLGVTGRAEVHRVDTAFSCARTREVPLDGSQDEFVPDLGEGDPASLAAEYDAPRYSFSVDREGTASLRLGNADGTLGSLTTYRREDDAWVMESSRACTIAATSAASGTSGVSGRGVADGPVLRLGTGDDTPWPAPRGAGEPGTRAVLVDDRHVVSHAGLAGAHHTLYAQPCGATVCLSLVEENGYVRYRYDAGGGVVQRLDEVMVDPDDAVGRDNPYQLWLAWDPDGDVAAVTADVEGETARAQRFTDPSWDGARLHALLLPADTDATVGALGTAVAERFDP